MILNRFQLPLPLHLLQTFINKGTIFGFFFIRILFLPIWCNLTISYKVDANSSVLKGLEETGEHEIFFFSKDSSFVLFAHTSLN